MSLCSLDWVTGVGSILGTPETEVPALAAQGRIGSGVPEDRPSGERVTAPVAVLFRERPLEERITRPGVMPVIPLLPVGRGKFPNILGISRHVICW